MRSRFALWLIGCACSNHSNSGKPTAESGRDGAVSAIAWRWDGPPPDRERPVASIEGPRGTHYRYADGPNHFGVVFKKETDSILWNHSLGARSGSAALRLGDSGDALYVAHYNPIASGAELIALRSDTGDELWRVNVEGLGPIPHSQYLNAVELQQIDGMIVVFGWESGGRYVEAHDRKTGRMVSNRTLSSP